MDIHKEFLRRLVTARKEIAIKLEELLSPDQSLKIYHRKLGDWNMDVIAKNEKILVIANDNFKESFEKVDFERTYKAKGEDYKAHFKSAYEQCQAAVKSNGNLSLNASVLGVAGPLYDVERHSNGYLIYDDLIFRVSDLYHLDEKFFSKIKNHNEKDISINNLAKLIYDLDKETTNTEVADPEGKEDSEPVEDKDEDQLVYSRNKILFGPPGTGKSYNIKSKMNLINVRDEHIIRTTFHPEYSYYEFVGQYKPVVAYEKVVGEIRYPNSSKTVHEKAFVYYDFVPGPFIKAIVNSLKLKDQAEGRAAENSLLIIEEINRGNSSAIFGDVFQLLDRINDVKSNYYGESEYSIDISSEMKEYIKKELKWDEEAWHECFGRGFIIPSNLYIYATMNTSDQSLFPVDSAFKRRWDMEYMYIDYQEEKLMDLYLPEPYQDIKWLDFIKKINEQIVNYTEVDDKQLGQWFVGNSLSQSEFLGKVISYLWFDIFRYDPGLLFKGKIKTFDDIRTFYSKGIFNKTLIQEILTSKQTTSEEEGDLEINKDPEPIDEKN